MKSVTLMRIKTNSTGALPSGFQDGMIVGMTDEEIATLKKNPPLLECFEEIEIKQTKVFYEPEPKFDPPSDTAPADTPAPVSP